MPTLLLFFTFFLFSFSSNASAAQGFPNDTIHRNGKTVVMHTGWDDGHVAEFASAYILRRHEVRLNIIGRSSYSFSNKVEISCYLPLIIFPNFALKYKFIDKPHFASALEGGTAVGILPVAAAGGIIMQGGAVGGAGIGLIHGSDNHLKLFLSFPVSHRLTFSFRGSISAIHAGYFGGAAIGGIGGDGAGAGLIPVSDGKWFRYLMGGFETDCVLNKLNEITLNTSLGGFKGGKKQLGLFTLAWTHAKIHFHYSYGLYGFYDPPTFEIIHQAKLPVSPYASVYWILNNGRKKG